MRRGPPPPPSKQVLGLGQRQDLEEVQGPDKDVLGASENFMVSPVLGWLHLALDVAGAQDSAEEQALSQSGTLRFAPLCSRYTDQTYTYARTRAHARAHNSRQAQHGQHAEHTRRTQHERARFPEGGWRVGLGEDRRCLENIHRLLSFGQEYPTRTTRHGCTVYARGFPRATHPKQ